VPLDNASHLRQLTGRALQRAAHPDCGAAAAGWSPCQDWTALLPAHSVAGGLPACCWRLRPLSLAGWTAPHPVQAKHCRQVLAQKLVQASHTMEAISRACSVTYEHRHETRSCSSSTSWQTLLSNIDWVMKQHAYLEHVGVTTGDTSEGHSDL